MQIVYKQIGQMLEISKVHEKYETKSIFTPKKLLSFKNVLRQS